MTNVRRTASRSLRRPLTAAVAAVAALGVMCLPVANASLATFTSSGTTTTAVTALTAYSRAVLNDNPIGYWRLDEPSGTVANDSIAGRSGTYVNDVKGTTTPGAAAWVKNGSTSAAFSLGQVKLPSLPINTAAGTTVTVEFWMNLPAGNDNRLIPFSFQSNWLYLWRGRFGFSSGNNDIYGTTDMDLLGRPVHVAAVFNNATADADYQSGRKIYIDGVQRPLTLEQGEMIAALTQTTAVASGASSNTSSRLPVGSRISDLAIYNGELSAAKIRAHFDAAAVPPPPLPAQTMLGYWRMDDWNLPNAMDSTLNNNNGQYISDSGGGISLNSAQLQSKLASSTTFTGGTMTATGVPVPTAAGGNVTVEFWMKVPTSPSPNGVIFSFQGNNLWLDSSYLAFNTGNSDTWGTSSTGLLGTTVFVAAVFSNDGSTAQFQANHKLYINGTAATMASYAANPPLLNTLSGNIAVSGTYGSTANRMPTGTLVSGLTIYQGELSAAQIATDYNSTK